MKLARRAAIVMAVSLVSACGVGLDTGAQAAPAGRVYVGCGTNYNHCVALHRAYSRTGIGWAPFT